MIYYSADVKNEWNYTCSPPHTSTACAQTVTFTVMMAGVWVKAQCIVWFAEYEATVTI